ncbi:hypothetical protein SK128_017144 [Halocaridina rubra]|uniref:Uncharacterized protein n=1 Tax=Halocaridina rubra TaxID=373956 RepID=A0AAN8WPN9_HALRR
MTLIQLLLTPKIPLPAETHITASTAVSATSTAISKASMISIATPTAPTISTAASTVPTSSTSPTVPISQSPPTLQADTTYQAFGEWHRCWNDFSKMVDLQMPFQLWMCMSLNIQRILEYTLGTTPVTDLMGSALLPRAPVTIVATRVIGPTLPSAPPEMPSATFVARQET